MATLYTVRFIPTKQLMMLAPIETVAVVLGLRPEAVARIMTENPCMLYNTRPHGTLQVSRDGFDSEDAPALNRFGTSL